MEESLKLLAGRWRGTGQGRYPTIETFEYRETLCFTWDGARPLLHYDQQTERRNNPQDPFVPSHRETGFLYLVEGDRVAMANAQLGGRLEALQGTVEPTTDGLVITLHSVELANDPRMEQSSRVLTLSRDSLHYVMHMQTTKVPRLALHLEATLQRQTT